MVYGKITIIDRESFIENNNLLFFNNLNNLITTSKIKSQITLPILNSSIKYDFFLTKSNSLYMCSKLNSNQPSNLNGGNINQIKEFDAQNIESHTIIQIPNSSNKYHIILMNDTSLYICINNFNNFNKNVILVPGLFYKSNYKLNENKLKNYLFDK